MRDPYDILGVSKSASQDDIRKAYRKLAKQHHPDLNKGNKASAEKFKEISAANAIVGDPETRAKFDRGEIDASGQEQRGFGFRRGPGGFGGGHPGGPGGGMGGGFGFDPEEMFADLFGRNKRARPRPGRIRGLDVRYALEVDFLEAARGGVKRLTLPGGKTLDVTVPAGIEEGQSIRLRGLGEPSPNDGETGDALVDIAIRAHPFFRREGADIHVEVPITLAEAVEGGKVTVPTIEGAVALTVKPHADLAKKLRLPGKGIVQAKQGKQGDQYVTLRIVLPDHADKELERFVAGWKGRDHDPRRKLGG
ncbi:MAG: J domain-containing protein [Alphaproteobacteria bacterium]|nr:J domain-containing protein [Alphaproteobacteria bacterium]